jgi:hypothetical protein
MIGAPAAKTAQKSSVRKEAVNEIVVFPVGYRSAVSNPCEENFILAKNLSLDGPNPGSSLFSL